MPRNRFRMANDALWLSAKVSGISLFSNQVSTKIPTGRPPGRPTKKTPQVVARMLATARSGLPLKFVAQAGGIAYDGFLDWRNRDSEFDQALEQARLASVQECWEQIMKLGKGTQEKPGDWKALAWSLERTEASSFARPEIQLIQQNNMTENHLSITINAEELRQIEAEGLPERQRVQEMFAAYRQGAVDYNDGEKKRILQAEPV